MKPEVEAHLRSLVNFPSPPGVATHIIDLARNPEIEMVKVAKALSLDSALSTKILRIANSPLYAQRRKSESLRQAIVVLGLNATLTLALSFTLVTCLRGGKPNGVSHPLYWRRALLAATSARALADAMHHPMAEEIFLAALLQDVGILALDQALPELYRGGEQAQRNHAALAQMEKAGLDTDHAQIGGWLMRTWNMPERLYSAIARSHEIEQSFTADADQIFQRCVALSGPVADLFLLGPEQRPFAETAQSAERCLGLDRMAFGQVLATVGAMIPETEAIFECESLAAQHPELIIEQAREVLMLRSLNAIREINTLRAVAVADDTAAGAAAGTAELEEQTRRDPLTGVYTRAHFDQVLHREFANAIRHGWPISVAFVDLDRFTSFNERFGQQAGDRVLQAAARVLRGNTRESDLVARHAGEKFVVVLPATDAGTARLICGRIVAAFAATEHVIGPDRVTVTLSIGCATHGVESPFATGPEFLDAAARALGTAKLRGRNRSVSFDRDLPQIGAPQRA